MSMRHIYHQETNMLSKLILGFVAIALTACGLQSASSGPQPTILPTFIPSASATQDPNGIQVPALGGKQSDNLIVWIFGNPNPPIRGGNTLEALVTDTAGQPISDARVSFDINMTNMNHGKNVVTASPLGEGRYSGDVFFLMPGPWRVIVGIERPGQTNTVRFDFMVNYR
jgi:hypothetical protein